MKKSTGSRTRYKAPFTQEEFDKRMQDKKMTIIADFKRDIRRSITVEKVLNKEVSSKINVTDQDITDYYNAHKGEFNLIEPTYHLAQIIVTPTPNPQAHNQNDKAQNEADARKKIQMISNRLDSGDDFATLAMKSPKIRKPRKRRRSGNGTWSPALKGTDPGTRDAVMNLKPGQYSLDRNDCESVDQASDGFRIVKAGREGTGRATGVIRSASAAGDSLGARDRREQLLKAAYYEVLRDRPR